MKFSLVGEELGLIIRQNLWAYSLCRLHNTTILGARCPAVHESNLGQLLFISKSELYYELTESHSHIS